MRSTRTRLRAISAVGAAAVVVGLGTVTFQASAAEQTRRPGRPRPVASPSATPSAPAPAPSATPAPTPTSIAPPAGLRPVGNYRVVTGTQTYTCANGSFEGASVPEARLAGPAGRIHHYGGPTWEHERDGSLVTAKVVAKKTRARAIPELLLEVTSHSGSPRGQLARATHIQRLQTTGGLAPTGACTDGEKASVRYGALYVFFGK
ncbi:DUF3455 domain-containing protein [Jidongwangia harbinensis]|uniref:DUF3455 domain-containing protein n=1 Tax=Jidongwangia harbinensis TaxID=2878561 RepID=UPI001CDA3F20|nr:DUF3455 domain-containing protein [Jidongwangia harbinensis]MCA2215940.1 DUF3455 domain-containing protein [Jidongwangia harbinensis]